MKQNIAIHASLLAFDIFELKNAIKNLHNVVDAFHVDFIDPSVAPAIGLDTRILQKLSDINAKFHIHYMACWNEDLVKHMLSYHPATIFFHERLINKESFKNLSQNHNLGIAIEVGEYEIDKACPALELDMQEYLLMNVKLGKCGQKFQDNNLELSKKLKKEGKIITSDGGINIENICTLSHFDNLVIGNGLGAHSVEELKKHV